MQALFAKDSCDLAATVQTITLEIQFVKTNLGSDTSCWRLYSAFQRSSEALLFFAEQIAATLTLMTNGNDNVNCKLDERKDPGKLVQRFEVVVHHVLLVGCDWGRRH